MEKKKLKKDIGDEQCFNACFYDEKPTPINELLDWLNGVKNQGATHISWRAITDDGSSEAVEAQAFMEYDETDEQCLAREAKEKQYRDKMEAYRLNEERRQYELLKRKFEQ